MKEFRLNVNEADLELIGRGIISSHQILDSLNFKLQGQVDVQLKEEAKLEKKKEEAAKPTKPKKEKAQ